MAELLHNFNLLKYVIPTVNLLQTGSLKDDTAALRGEDPA